MRPKDFNMHIPNLIEFQLSTHMYDIAEEPTLPHHDLVQLGHPGGHLPWLESDLRCRSRPPSRGFRLHTAPRQAISGWRTAPSFTEICTALWPVMLCLRILEARFQPNGGIARGLLTPPCKSVRPFVHLYGGSDSRGTIRGQIVMQCAGAARFPGESVSPDIRQNGSRVQKHIESNSVPNSVFSVFNSVSNSGYRGGGKRCLSDKHEARQREYCCCKLRSCIVF